MLFLTSVRSNSTGLYDIHIELKHIPLLGWNAPQIARYKIQARDIMTKELKTLPLFNKVGDLYDILNNVKHGAFPVVKVGVLVFWCLFPVWLFCVFFWGVLSPSPPPPPFEHACVEVLLMFCVHALTYVATRRTLRRKAADGGGNLALGWILTTELVMLLHKKAYGPRNGDTVLPRGVEGGELKWEDFRTAYPRWLDISDVPNPTNVEREMWIDLRPYMNAHPHSLREGSSLARTFDLFRTMGLRHLLITDDYNRLKGIVSRKDLYGVESHHTYEDFN